MYTTLEDLKQWPKLHEWVLCQYEDNGLDYGDDLGSLGMFIGSPDDRDFLSYVYEGDIDEARDMRPELFEEEQAFVRGRRYKLLQDDETDKYPQLVGQTLQFDDDIEANRSSFYFIAADGTRADFYLKAKAHKNAVLEPLHDEQEEEEIMDRIIDERADEESNRAMLDRDGIEEMCNTQELWDDPMAKHSEALSRAMSVTPFAITKFDPRGM